ncbi:fibrobacter succinogenes major paralogous domain-containing protein [Aquiflexum gelatinilyticum]|uniref:Fibrobacter succinogenes major paralogous domain-containing protein n=1 Tax=Aquiflexum gelatinilyticum TaxID=2961943 RepID=A0A9X2T244_9BACT|nr:fibrobacter succinogenes major paralogous domain-containing protein [Aquiflexum gelatinilyticum]MCR9017508.1 fibrobacter succinogenes major paralogous domain-containing protein [Aquiflexum gelatinilyticum]
MKRFIFLSAIVILTLSACDVEEVPVPVNDRYVGIVNKLFVSYKIATFDPGPLEGNPEDGFVNYEGEFGGIPIEAGKTDKNEVIFVVPNLPAGSYQLKLKIGNENRIWDVQVVDLQQEIDNFDEFWSDYAEGKAEIYDSLKNHPRLNDFAKYAKKWSNYFESKFSLLSQSEKNELIQIIHLNGFNNLLPYYFETYGEFENCLKANFAVFSWNSIHEGESLRELKSKMVYLPYSRFNDALVAFVFDLIWRHRAMIEISAPKLLACPILRDVQLRTKWGLVGNDPIILNSGDSLEFEVKGIYTPLSDLDKVLYPDENGIGFIATYVETSISQVKEEDLIVSSLIQKRKLDLPFLHQIFSFQYVPEQDTKPLTDFSFQVDAISNPYIILSQKSQKEDQVILTFERKNPEQQDFQFTLNFVQSGFAVSRFIKGTMAKTTESILDLSFDSGTANLQILSGEPPYQIEWSNGVTNQTQVKFTAGNYSVKVTDGNGSEEVIDFSIPEFGTVQDREGNEYQTVKIGNQWWMAENLRNTIRKDGRPVQEREYWPPPNPYNPEDFDYASFSYYNNDPKNDKEYGKLYSFTSYGGCLCPDGWGIPTFEDFTEMANVLGGLGVAGKKLKSRSTWQESIFNSTNESGFNAKPGGMKINNNIYESKDIFVGWWVSGPGAPERLASLDVENLELKLTYQVTFFFEGHYIRCIKKQEGEPSC